MFKKTNLKHDLKYSPGIDLLYSYGYDEGQGWVGVRYYSIIPEIADKIYFALPESIRDKFEILLMEINRPIIPGHIDEGIKTAINFYVNTADAVTKYHRLRTDTESEIVLLDTHTTGTGRLFRDGCLETISEFKSESGEVWVLDVSKIHSVECGKNEVRTAFCATSAFISFEETVAAFDLI